MSVLSPCRSFAFLPSAEFVPRFLVLYEMPTCSATASLACPFGAGEFFLTAYLAFCGGAEFFTTVSLPMLNCFAIVSPDCLTSAFFFADVFYSCFFIQLSRSALLIRYLPAGFSAGNPYSFIYRLILISDTCKYFAVCCSVIYPAGAFVLILNFLPFMPSTFA